MSEVLTAPELSQQKPSAKFLPAFFVDIVELGQEFNSGELPAHMTYFPPIEEPYDPQYAVYARKTINELPPFSAQVGSDALFGDNRDIPVRIIQHDYRILEVHRRLISVLGHLQHDFRYRTPYNPHITIVDEEDVRTKQGARLEMGGLSIVEKLTERGTWKVMAKIGLKGSYE